ncbi:MetS family NSS transporter small subunit [Dongshaea marina]
MSSISIFMLALGFAITWGGAACCLYLAVRAKQT